MLIATGIASIVLSSCGLVSNPGNAFSVDGTSFSRDDLNSLVKELAKADQLTVVNQVAQSKDLLGIMDVVIQYRTAKRLLETRGTPVTDAEREKIRDDAASQLPQSMDPGTVDLLVDISATGRALDKIQAPTPAELESMYLATPASTGYLCVREITVRSQETAKDVVDQLADGKKFEDLARKLSVTKNASTTGGAVLSGTGLPCLTVPAAGAEPALGETVVRALLATKVGSNTGVIRDSAGWHVAEHRPFADVKDSLLASLKDTPGRAYASGLLATADIKVNALYGRWNPVTAKVE